MTPAALPTPIDFSTPIVDVADLALRVARWTRDADEWFRTQPSDEVLSVDVDPDSLPIVVQCQTRTAQIRGVTRMQTVSLTDSLVVDDTGLGWRQATDSDVGGFELSSLPGCTAGTTYTVTFRVTGERG